MINNKWTEQNENKLLDKYCKIAKNVAKKQFWHVYIICALG